MNSQDIKLVRNKDQYGRTYYICNDSKLFPELKISKHYGYDITPTNKDYHCKEKNVTVYFHQGLYSKPSTLKRVKEYIAQIDNEYLAMIEHKYQERLERDRQYEIKRDNIKSLGEEFLKPVDTKLNEFVLNQFVLARFASMNKCQRVGEYLEQLANNQKDQDGYSNYYDEKVKIIKVVTLSNEDFDNHVNDLLDDREYFLDENGERGYGGHDSTYQLEDESKDFYQLSELERELWRKSSYALGVLIQSENRTPYIANPEGYEYARYVGLEIKVI